METGVFPSKLKIAKVIPIYKSKDKQSFTNYRPISLLPSISKIYEKIVHNRLYSYMTMNSLMNKNQYGFRKGHSTINAVSKFTYDTLHALDSGNYNLSVFLDLSKAFDTINHSLLCKKLSHYGIRGVALGWFRSYLTERKQYVSYKGTDSKLYPIICGVPQGSVLGPLLFIIYSNDLP
jgi:retron-type reverse transcriptase